MKERSYNYLGYTAFKDMSKENLRYIKGSYSIEPNIIHLVYDTSRIGSIRLPAPIVGHVSYYGSIMRVDLEGDFNDDAISSHCYAISALIRGVPSLLPIEVRLNNPLMYPVLRCYNGDNWSIKDAVAALKGTGVWLYLEKE